VSPPGRLQRLEACRRTIDGAGTDLIMLAACVKTSQPSFSDPLINVHKITPMAKNGT